MATNWNDDLKRVRKEFPDPLNDPRRLSGIDVPLGPQEIIRKVRQQKRREKAKAKDVANRAKRAERQAARDENHQYAREEHALRWMRPTRTRTDPRIVLALLAILLCQLSCLGLIAWNVSKGF